MIFEVERQTREVGPIVPRNVPPRSTGGLVSKTALNTLKILPYHWNASVPEDSDSNCPYRGAFRSTSDSRGDK
jgi:hypothetical protein